MSNMINSLTIKGVRGYIDENATAFLNLEDVCRGLGFTETKGDYIRWQRVDGYLSDFGFSTCGERKEFIPENIFYRLAMKAKNEIAENFQAMVCDEILPQIRKAGYYKLPQMTSQEIMIATLQEQQKVIARVDGHDVEIEEIKSAVNNKIIIDSRQRELIKRAIAKRVYARHDFNKADKYLISSVKEYFGRLHSEIRRRFEVPTYSDLKEKDFDDCINYINNWIEPNELKR